MLAMLRTFGVLGRTRCFKQPEMAGLEPLPTSPLNRVSPTFSTAATTTAAEAGAKTQPPMSFEDYRKLKKSLKMRARIAGIPTALLGTTLSSAIAVYLNPRMFEMTPEEVQLVLGMDPIMLSALCGVGSGILGYLAGGAIFSSTWKMMARSKYEQVKKRDIDFLQRLQKHRFSDVNKYEDDYYGDKIMTLSDYRQWIRKQQKRKETIQAQETAAAVTTKEA